MIGPSTVLAGVPPAGLGIYTRSRVEPGPWGFRAVDPRLGGGELARAARRTGPIWLFQGPDAWRPETWRATLASLLAAVGPFDATGVIPNPEAGWAGATLEEMTAFAIALRAAAVRTRVCVVTIPTWGPFEVVARIAGRAISWSMELYSHSTPLTAFASHWARWRRHAGLRVTLSIAGFVPQTPLGRLLETPEGYQQYLDALPSAGGVIVWPTYPIRRYMLDAIARKYTGVGGAAMVPFALASSLDTYGGLALLALVLLMFIASIVGAGRA